MSSAARHPQAATALADWPGVLIGVHSTAKPAWTVRLRHALESRDRPQFHLASAAHAAQRAYLLGVAAHLLGPWPDFQFVAAAINASAHSWPDINVSAAQEARACARCAEIPGVAGTISDLPAEFAAAIAQLRDHATTVGIAQDASTGPAFKAGWYDSYFNAYGLTPTAAAGILVRAAKRGRALPATLDQALRALASSDPKQADRLPAPQPTMADVEQVSSLTRALGEGGPDAARAQAGWLIPANSAAADISEPLAWEARVARNGRGAPSAVVPALKAEAGGTGRGDAAPLLLEAQQRVVAVSDVSPTITSREAKGPDSDCTNALVVEQGDPVIGFSTKDYGNDATDDCSPTLRSMSHDKSHANGGGQMGILHAAPAAHGTTVRRLTPRECEALQGLPGGWTAYDDTGTPVAPSVRYRALGNACTANVLEYVGHQLHAVLTGIDSTPAVYRPATDEELALAASETEAGYQDDDSSD